jgi:hypothetical protein
MYNVHFENLGHNAIVGESSLKEHPPTEEEKQAAAEKKAAAAGLKRVRETAQNNEAMARAAHKAYRNEYYKKNPEMAPHKWREDFPLTRAIGRTIGNRRIVSVDPTSIEGEYRVGFDDIGVFQSKGSRHHQTHYQIYSYPAAQGGKRKYSRTLRKSSRKRQTRRR